MKRRKNRIQLTKHEKTQLERIKSKHTTPQNEAKRAHIIMLADEGVSYLEIARRLEPVYNLSATFIAQVVFG